MTTALAERTVLARPAACLVSLLGALLAVAAVASTATTGLTHVGFAATFAVLIALGEVARVRLPGGRESAPVGGAAALSYALAGTAGAVEHGVLQTIAVVAVATILGALPHAVAGASLHVEDLARRLLVVGGVAAAYRPFLSGYDGSLTGQVLVMLSAVAAAAVADIVLAALLRAERQRAPFGPTLGDESRAQVGIATAIGATGVLVALAADELGLWSIPVFCAPLLVTQFSFRRYAAIRATYLQTIRALSRVTEVGGYVEAGHARRVGELACLVGRDLGMTEPELLDLEYAANLHDIGQLTFTDPIPGGSTLVLSPDERRRVAELGADIIRRTHSLDTVAEIVAHQADPYRRPGQLDDPSVPLGSRVIKVVNAFDDMAGASGQRQVRDDALEHLRLSMAFEYDPRVIESLARVLSRHAVPVG